MFNKIIQKLRGSSKPQYKRYTRSKAGNISLFIILTLAGVFSALPLVFCINAAFKPLDELLKFPPTIFVKRPTTENFLTLPAVLSSLGVPVSRYFFNSLFISIAGSMLHIFAASMSAFVFSKTLCYNSIMTMTMSAKLAAQMTIDKA